MLLLGACEYHTTSPGHTPCGIRIHDTPPRSLWILYTTSPGQTPGAKCCIYPLQSSVWIQLPAHTPDGIHIHGTPPRSLLYTFVRTPSPPWSRTPCHTKQDKTRCSMSSSRKPQKCAKMRSKCSRQLCIITLLLEPLNI